jgi:glycosyltransferase involved in cell wall biosynthesis
MRVSVVIPTHKPDPERLRRTLLGLRARTLPANAWETLLADNASTQFPAAESLAVASPANLPIVQESSLGLSSARRTGLATARGRLAVLVDDDNVLAPDYPAETAALFDAWPGVGAIGGKSSPEFAVEPPDWAREFFHLLALRDLGPETLIATSLHPPGGSRDEYPLFAPIGAGMALRRPAWTASVTLSDRRGQALTSSGDNDIILCALRAGWSVAYSPRLSLTYLIPSARLEPDYLARLNRGIQNSWMQVLTLHAVNP